MALVDTRSPSRATIEQVAARAGVSTATVSRVLNGTGQVSTETRRRVHEAVADLKYMPHAAARALASNRTNTLGLMLPNISDEFFPPLLRGVGSNLRRRAPIPHSPARRQTSGAKSRRKCSSKPNRLGGPISRV